jgi:hypothetical protein
MLLCLHSDRCSVLLSHNFSRGRKQLDKDFPPRSIKLFSALTISKLLPLEIGAFRGPKLPKTHCKQIVGATTVETRDIMPTDAPICTPMPIRLLMLHQPPLVEPTLFWLLPSRTMLMGGSTMLLWRKLKKLQTLSLVCFSSTILPQLCCLILEHRIHSYPLHMLRSIICL